MVDIILMGIISLAVAIFAIQNAVSVEISFLFWHFTMSLALIILGCLILGFIIASLWTLKAKTSHFMKERKYKEQIRQLEEELDEMQAAAPRFTETKVPRSDFAGKGYDPKKDQNPIIRPFRPED